MPQTAPGSRYIDFLIPGLMGLSLMGGGLWGVGFVAVEMRVRKLLKRFLATPMRRWQFLLSIMVSRMLFMIPEMLLLVCFSRWAFGVRIFGSPWAVAALVLLGAVCFAGIGLLVASRTRTLEAVNGILNLIMLPMWMASGVFFPRERYPEAVQPLLRAMPLTGAGRCLASRHAGGGISCRLLARGRHTRRVGNTNVCVGTADFSVGMNGVSSKNCREQAAAMAPTGGGR